MKRLFLTLLMSIGLLATLPSPANAIFGLSTCEKVKKEMLSLEKSVIRLEKITGTFWNQKKYGQTDKIWSPNKEGQSQIQYFLNNDIIQQIWKLGTNNPKCFTNTQNMQIKTYSDKHSSSYWSLGKTNKYSSSLYCDKLLSKGVFALTDADEKKLESKCVVSKEPYAIWLTGYNSIYDY